MKAFVPFILLATLAHAAQLTTTWGYPLGYVLPSGFVIERGKGNVALVFEVVATLPGTVRAYTDTGLVTKTKYSYRIRSFIKKADGTEVYSMGYSNVVARMTK